MRFFLNTAWFVSVFVGLGVLSWYKFTPGEQVEIANQWPADAIVLQSVNRANLIMFVHPECPCSLASVEELGKLLPKIAKNVAVKIVFRELPANSQKPIEEHTLWKKAKALTQVELIVDPARKYEEMFQAKTSGQTYLFDRRGQKIFQGGLTPLRGHTGETQAATFITHWVQQQTIDRSISSKVFGCAMQEKKIENL